MNVKFALVDLGIIIPCTQHDYFRFVCDLEDREIPFINSYLGDMLATYTQINGMTRLVAMQWGCDSDLD